MNEHSQVHIECPAFAPGTIHLVSLSGKEAISQLFELRLLVVTTDPAGLDTDAVIGAPAQLVFERGGKEQRRMGGIIAAIHDSMHEETGRMVYDLWFSPRAFRLGLTETYEIFMDVSVLDIVKKKLERAGLEENKDYELRLTGNYAPREFTVQYQETDLGFVSRLLEHHGIAFYFDHRDGKDVMVLSDDNSGFAPPTGGEEVPFRSRGEQIGIFALESRTRMTPGSYRVKDYNYRTPQVALQASAPSPKGDGGYVLEYGAHFKSPDEGAKIAKIRAEELGCRRTIYEGKSDRQALFAGAKVLVEGHPRGDLKLILTEVEHRAANATLGAGKEHARDYENTFKAVLEKTPFRPSRVTPKPRIHGVITGVIDAAAKGPYAELDSDGRYRVRFLFDPGTTSDGQASRLCRMAQPHGGGGYGMHFPLRSGVEVILTFVEGDPDRPIILGVVPNPQTPSPVTAGNGTRNVIRTGGGNEINIDDTAGSERIKLSTPKSGTVLQLGAPNLCEDGASVKTDANYSMLTNGASSFVSPIFNTMSSYYKIKSASDITQFCGVLQNSRALLGAWVDAVATGIGDVKGAFDGLDVKANSLGEELGKHVEDQENRQAILDAEIKEAEKAYQTAFDAAVERSQGASQEVIAEERHKLAEMEKAIDGKKKRADELSAHIEKEKVEIAKYKTAVEDSWAHAASEVVDKVGKVAETGKSWISTLGDQAGFLAQEESAALVTLHIAAGGAQGLGTKVDFPFPMAVSSLWSPAFTGGAENCAFLVAGNHVLVSGKSAKLVGVCDALVSGGAKAAIRSSGTTELFGVTSAILHSLGAVTLTSEKNIVEIASGMTTTITAGGRMTTTSDGLTVTSKKDWALTAEQGDATVTVSSGALTADAKAGNITLQAHAKKSEISLTDSATSAKHESWGITVGAGGVDIGKHARKNEDLWITDKTISVKRGGGLVTVANNNLSLKGGKTTISMVNSGLVVKGTRIDLG